MAIISAIYSINDEFDTSDIWNRLKYITENTIIHLICSKSDESKITSNIIPYYIEFNELETYKIFQKATKLPRIRNEKKDTLNFMILMNAKSEFIKIVKDANKDVKHYIWLDAGISKIFKNPSITLKNAITLIKTYTNSDNIIIPGCWPMNTNDITKDINWRFCGGFVIVPSQLVDLFYHTVCFACEYIIYKSNVAIWEVNTWAYIESLIPIKWQLGDHNEHIFDCISNQKL